MTKHVRSSYRRHRRASWALALGLALLVAAVAIPLATGAPGKTYTLLFPSSGAVTPAAPTPGSTSAQTLCTDAPYTSVKLVISNTSRTVQLGSADVSFPSIVTLSGASFSGAVATGATINRSGNVVSLRGLSLPARSGNTISSVTFSVSLDTQTAPAAATAITARVKQANDFSDSGSNPDANSFDDPAFPTLALQTCTTTISGRVYHDRNADSTYTTGTGAFDDSDLPKGWRVDVFAKSTSSSAFPTTPLTSATAASDTGLYSVTVPLGRDYKLCVVATGDDAGKAWGLQGPVGNAACGEISSTSASSSAARLVENLAAAVTDQDFVAVPATPPFGAGDTSTLVDYVVIAGSNSTKDPRRYTHETWVDGSGATNFRFAPILPCAAPEDCSKEIYLIETLTANVSIASLSGSQAQLLYDDDPPFLDGELEPMPYCNKDPRPANWPTDKTLATAGVLPEPDSSCIVEASQTVIPDGKLRVRYVVYTNYDGGRQIG